MRGDKFDLVSFYAYKFSAALFCFFGFLLTELGIYLNPTFGPSLFRTTVMVVVFFVSVLEWRGFFVGKFGTAIYKGSVSAYISIIMFFICGIMAFLSIFYFHNGLFFIVGILAAYNGFFSVKAVEKMKKEINKDTDFFKIYFNK
ncbi:MULTISPECIES: hypothetical protein [Acidithiobacillus]|uniref:hypothetical protein n=1 Tax=Acidithiobacillus TaxID=119977 RepID=UPI002147CAD8|nr:MULTISPECIES: hypothetical protein [Acidithiobacillus]MCR1347452.1 hypothetical protein [Acidithiobacillus ferrooxidans]MCR1354890.1 hypothetical protein [Acidithiobacillus ferrooxidans]